MYYFGYCTFLNEPERKQYLPDGVAVTKGYAANRRVEFRGTTERSDRGWCHLTDGPAARGKRAYGVVFEHPDEAFEIDHPAFERCFLTVYGEDGITYDCWTYRLISPGEKIRPPNFYWAHVPAGLDRWQFPTSVAKDLMTEYEEARPSDDPDQPAPY